MDNKEKNDICDCFDIEKVLHIKSSLLADEIIYDMADLFKIFSDSTRLKILYKLLNSEMRRGFSKS